MGFAQTLATGAAIAATSIAAEARPTSVDPAELSLDRSAAITITYNPDDDRQQIMMQRDGASSEASPSAAAASVAAEPPRDESAGSRLLRRSKDRDEGKPATAPAADPAAEVKPTVTTQPAAKPAAETQPATAAASQPTSPAPAAATTAEVKPTATVSTASAFDKWKTLTPEAIQKLSPEEMTKLLADREAIMRQGTYAAKVSEQRAAFYQTVNEILLSNKEGGETAQLKALKEYFAPAFAGEKADLDGWAKGQADQRKDLASGLVGGVPLVIVENVKGLNEARAGFKAELAAQKGEMALQQDYSWNNYSANKAYFDKAKQDLWLPRIELPNLDVFKQQQAEKKPEEVEKERVKSREEAAKVAIFDPYKKLEDVTADPAVIAATKEVDLADAVRLVMGPGGEPVLTPGEQRIKVEELSAFVDAARSDTETWQSRQTASVESINAEAGARVKAEIARLLDTRDTLTKRRVDLEAAQNTLNTPQMSPDQQMALQMYLGVKQDEATAGMTQRDIIVTRNWARVTEVNTAVDKYIGERQADYDAAARFRNNPIQGTLEGIFKK